MTSINLLPWRELLRKERQRQFMSMAGFAALFSLAVILYVHFHVNSLIGGQLGRNTMLESEIKVVEAQIKEIEALESEKKRLLARMEVIQQLQSGRPQIVHVFEELVSTLPEGVYLTKIKQNNDSLVLEGFAQSNARVSAYMRNLDASAWFADPKLDVIQSSEVGNVQLRTSKFSLQVKQVNEALAAQQAPASEVQ